MKRVIRLFYGFQFFFSLLLWLPIFYEYQKKIGLDDHQIFAIQSIYYIAFCLMEIPTGLLADRFGYRRCLRWGAGLLVLTNLLPIFVQNYSGFLWHFLLIALSRSFISGASSAYLYEYLQQNKAGEIYKEIEGKARAYSLFGKVACWAAVGPLMEWSFTMPYWLTALSALISVGLALLLPDVRELTVNARTRWIDRIKELGLSLEKSPLLIFLMTQGVAIFVLARVCQVNLFQPILESKTLPISSFGLVMSMMTIFEAAGSLKPGWFRKLMNDFNAVYFLTFVMAVTLGIIPWLSTTGTLISLCLFSLATGLSFPIQRQLMNDAVPDSRYRATLLSIESIIDRATNAVVAAFMGGYLASGRLAEFLRLSGYVTVAAILALILFAHFFKLSARRAVKIQNA